MKQAKKKATPIKPAAGAIPEWLEETPNQSEYYHMAMELDSEFEQGIQLTRDEFCALKLHLAKLRGIEIPAEVQNAA